MTSASASPAAAVSQLSDEALVRRLRETVALDRQATAGMLRLIAEVDRRRLWAHGPYGSIYAWCLGELGMSEDMAAKRIQVARTARRLPEVFAMLGDGRLTLTGAALLAPYLRQRRHASSLLVAATHRTNDQIRKLLAARFPRPDVPTVVRPLLPAAPIAEAQASSSNPSQTNAARPHGMDGCPISHAAQHVGAPGAPPDEPALPASPVGPAPRIAPVSPQAFSYQFTLRKAAHEKLEYAKALLGRAVPTGDVTEVLERALDALIEKLEREKLGKRSRTARPGRPASKPVANERHIPDRIKTAVWQRDGGQCTFTAADGRRCEARARLEFDHVVPLARGGLSTADNLRLMCRAHNQREARRLLGTAFVDGRREARSQGACGHARREDNPAAKSPAPA